MARPMSRLRLLLAAAVLNATLAPAGPAGAEPGAAHGDGAATAFAGPALVPVEALAAVVAAWIVAEGALPLPAALPEIGFAPPARLAAMHRGAAAAAGEGGVVALYEPARRRLLLPEGWAGRSHAEIAVLVHEMVHHLQHMAGRRFACPAQREAEAYGLQARWLALAGDTGPGAPDPMMLRLLSVCGF
jgi:hypothetical protein